MESGPAKKKLKKCGKTADGSRLKDAEASSISDGRKKAWHESKKLMKRVALLLNDPSIIPPDVFFHVGEDAELFRGHK